MPDSWWFDRDAALAFLTTKTGKAHEAIIRDGDLDRLRDVRREFIRARGFLLPLEDAEQDGHLDPNGTWRDEAPHGENLPNGPLHSEDL